MTCKECITLLLYLKAIPDERHARGKQYPLWVLVTILCVGVLSGEKTVWGIVEWAVAHGGELVHQLKLPKGRIPSRSTFYVAMRKIGIEGLERQIGQMGTGVVQSLAQSAQEVWNANDRCGSGVTPAQAGVQA